MFYQKEIEDLIRNYLSSFLTLPDAQVSERWLGNYVSRPSEEPWIYKPIDGVMIVNRIGGVGMTTSSVSHKKFFQNANSNLLHLELVGISSENFFEYNQ